VLLLVLLLAVTGHGSIIPVQQFAALLGLNSLRASPADADLWKIDILFVVGGRGGNAAAQAIHRECRARQVPCCVVAVPKSIDNDLLLIDKTFGFETAVEEAQKAILAAKVEASSACEAVLAAFLLCNSVAPTIMLPAAASCGSVAVHSIWC
jgi:hypothetical protein